jgi:Flp pilus assembly protein TadB
MAELIACLIAGAVIALGLATAPRDGSPQMQRRHWFDSQVERRGLQLRAARLHIDPRRYTLACIAVPAVSVAVGLVLGSPVLAAVSGAAGILAPRWYLAALVAAQRRRSEAEAPQLVQSMVASLTAGRTYLEMFVEARRRAHDRWIRDDLDQIITRFHLDIPLEESVAEVRRATTSRNLGLIWDNLAICMRSRIPTTRARDLLVELSDTVQFNTQLQQEVRSRTSGQRAQIWMLAAIVPGLFAYLRFVNPDFFTVLDTTTLGRFFLLPAAMVLEVTGIWLSFRLSQVEA